MIRKWSEYALAFLEDGRVVKNIDATWTDTGMSTTNPSIDTSVIILFAACPRGTMLVVLLQDGRILVGLNPKKELIDITPFIQTFIEDTTCIRSVHTMNRTVVVQTDYCIGTVIISTTENRSDVSLVLGGSYSMFPCEIDLVRFGYDRGFVRTIDNKLYLIASQDQRIGNSSLSIKQSTEVVRKDLYEVDFPRASDISEILSYGEISVFLMFDGSVFEASLYGDLIADNSVIPVQFPDGEIVSKIAFADFRIIYITEAGNCYHTLDGWSRMGKIDPTLIQNQYSRGAIDAFILQYGSSAIIKYSNEKLYYVRFNPAGYLDPVQSIVPLPFFDGKGIVSVIDLSSVICFISSEGHVYYVHNIDSDPVIVRDTFFDDNILASKSNINKIKSARSYLRRDA